MKINQLALACFLLLTAFAANSQTAFTYQGRLIDNGVRANGSYDLSFALYDAVTDGNLVGIAITNTSVAVSNGLFTTSLDFGASAFTNGSRWLEISEATNGSGNFTLLTPRQALTAAPYAVVAGTVAGAIAASQLSGVIADGQLSTNVALLNGSANFAGTVSAVGGFVGDGSGVTNIALSGLDSRGGLALTTNNAPFRLSTTFPVSGGANWVVSTDVNNDGYPDLIVVDSDNDEVIVYLNDGAGHYSAFSTNAVGSGPYSLAVTDVNGDGYPDIVTANFNASTVTVLPGNGDGTFNQSIPDFYVNDDPGFVTVTDVNNDGQPDLVLVNYYQTISVYLGNGDGTFNEASNSPYAVASNPLDVQDITAVVADVNLDGSPDLVVADQATNSISVLTNDSFGNFTLATTAATGQRPVWVTAADMNGDGSPDLITANADDKTALVLTNDGSGGFFPASTYPVGAVSSNQPDFLVATNLFGPGLPDLVAVNGLDDTLTILTNDGTGNLVFNSTIPVNVSPIMVAAADVDGDGKLDLLAASYYDNTLLILTNHFGQTSYDVQFSGNFSGSGANLTSLNASALRSGTISDGLLSGNVPLISANQPFFGLNYFINPGNYFNGTFTGAFIGDGGGLTNVTVSASQVTGGFSWQTTTDTSVQAQPNVGYLLLNSSPVTVTLPASANTGDIVRVSGVGAGGWQIAQQDGQSIIGAGVVGGVHPSVWGMVAGSPTESWNTIASSADGTKLVAAGYDSLIYTSTDSGVTWTAQFGDGSEDWTAVASSADGSKLVAVDYFSSDIYTSTDSGTNWTAQSTGGTEWTAVASSADGTLLVAATADSGQIYTSTDSGVTWTLQFSSSGEGPLVASSADGAKLVAVDLDGQIYTSTDSGTNWALQFDDVNQSWHSVTSSADGTKLAAVAYGSSIYTSTDSGLNWTPQFGDGSQSWTSISSSTDGTKLFALADGGSIYASTDSGVTWTSQFNDNNPAWFSVAISADGSKAATVASGSQIYTYAPSSTTTATTTGTGGYLQGGQNTSIELIYIGNGQFLPISHEGTINAN